eukprot:m.254736 g.254736  ORF g.254736 m.254736 type:complete len:580 (-) comp19109_c0_seq1:69-1808(-)
MAAAALDINVWGSKTATHEGSSHTVYEIEVRVPGQPARMISHRYSVLLAFHQKLLAAFPDQMAGCPEFPKKSAFGGLGSSITTERVRQLTRYFAYACVLPLADSLLFREFFGIADGAVLYRTVALCPVCAVRERSEVRWHTATVLQKGKNVCLAVACAHDPVDTVLSTDAAYYIAMLRPHLPGLQHEFPLLWPVGLTVRQDQMQAVRAQAVANSTYAIVSLFEQGQFVDDVTVLTAARQAGRKALILLGGLAADMAELTRKIRVVEKATENPRIIVELTHERLAALAALDDSALLSDRVFPAVKYFVRRGEELQCHHDLVGTISELACYRGIHVAVTLAMERPFADLQHVLAMLRRHKSRIRMINVSLCRPHSEIMHTAVCKTKKRDSIIPEKPVEPNVDYFQMLRRIEAWTDGEITPTDFFSPAYLRIVETLVVALGVERHPIRLSPVTGCVAVLVNTATLDSVPITRVVDMAAFAPPMLAACAEFEAGGVSAASSLMFVRKTLKLLKQHLRAGVEARIPGLLQLATDSGSRHDIGELFNNCQVIHVRRAPDMGYAEADALACPLEISPALDALLAPR